MHAPARLPPSPGPPPGERSQRNAPPSPPARPGTRTARAADATLPFMVTEETHRQPGSSAPPRKFALSSSHCAPMAAALRAGRLRSSLPLPPPLQPPPPPACAPRSVLCAAGLPRAPLTPGGRRRARQRPSPWPPGRAGRRVRAPLAPSRARPALGPALAPVQSLSPLFSLRPRSPRVLAFPRWTSRGAKSKESFLPRSSDPPWCARRVLLLLSLCLDPKLN